MKNVKKEREETKCDGGWEKADFIKQSGCWPFYSSHTKGLQKHHRHTNTHTKCSHTSGDSDDRGWRREGQWMIKQNIS